MSEQNGHNATALTEALGQYEATVELLTERIAELEFAAEDAGWQRLDSESGREFSRAGLGKIIALSRLMWLKNPLINRSVNVQALYVWAQGWSVEARDETVDVVIQAFLDERGNQSELTSHQARTLKEIELQVSGNIFFVFFSNPATGAVRVRTLPVDEVVDIICNPDDGKEPWLYKRSWTATAIDLATGQSQPKPMAAYYPDWRYQPASRWKTIGRAPVLWDTPVYHVKVGGLSDMRFGVPETYQALDWAKAYKSFLEDWATITRSYARFAWNLVTPGGKAGVAAAKTKLGTTLNAGGAGGYDTNPPPLVGSTFIAAEGGTKLDPIRTSGATTSADDGRHLKLMVAAAVGLPETFYGDTSVGNLATAKTLDRPTELKFRDRQTLWIDIFQDIFAYVIEQAAKAPGGKVKGTLVTDPFGNQTLDLGDLDDFVDISFPSILERDTLPTIQAIIAGATLDGKAPVGTMTDRVLCRLILSALGEDDIDELLDEIAPHDGESLMATMAADRSAHALEIATAAPAVPIAEPGAPPGQKALPAPSKRPVAEALMVEAVRELREAIKRAAP